jgi:hypothetical protein
MSVSVLPSSLYGAMRGLVRALATRGGHAPVGDLRSELAQTIRVYGQPARVLALQIAVQEMLTTSAQQVASPSKALEQFLADELAELQRREPFKWPAMIAKVLETASQATGGKDEALVARFSGAAGLSHRQSLAVAVQLVNRSSLPRLQHAGVVFLTQALSWSNLPSLSQDNKAWSSLPEELLHDLSYIVTSHPAFPIEQKQAVLQSLQKITPGDSKRELKLREEGADLVSGISAHTNATSSVAMLLQDLGYSISSSVESFKETLHPFPKLNEQDVARSVEICGRTARYLSSIRILTCGAIFLLSPAS